MENRDKIERLEDLISDTIDGELVEQKVTSLLPPGENYGSIIYKVDFKVKKDGKEKEYHAVAKCTPPNQVTQELFNTQDTFKSEIAWYNTVIPTLKKFAKEQGLERELDFFQPFYGARISLDPKSEKVDLDGVILTENLKYLGYHNIDRHEGFDAPVTFSILRDLATFHAVPLAIRLKDPKLYETNLKPFTPFFTEFTGSVKEQFDKGPLETVACIPEVAPYLDRITKVIKSSDYFGPREEREPWLTIMHMDLWSNNIMITGGDNSKNIILDLQIPRIGSVVGDLMFFLLTSVKLTVIKDRMDEFIKFYYDEFIKNITQLKVCSEKYTLESLWKDIDIEMKFCEFSHSLFHSYLIMKEKRDESMDSSNLTPLSGSGPANERQIEKIGWIAMEAVKRNWV